jgi:FkbM family methyltransferase
MPFTKKVSPTTGILSLEIELKGKSYQMLMPNDNSSYAFEEVFERGCYPLLPLKNFKPEAIMDIGACMGDTALYFHVYYPEAKVHIYEPSSKNLFFLEKNVKNFSNVTVHPYGLAKDNKEVELYFGFTGLQSSIHKNNETTSEKETIQLKSIAEEIKGLDGKVGILKVDIEGGELQILEEVLKHCPYDIPLVYLEYHNEDDRLQIDQLMKAKYNLGFAQAFTQHRGTNLYVLKTFKDEGYFLQPPIITK